MTFIQPGQTEQTTAAEVTTSETGKVKGFTPLEIPIAQIRRARFLTGFTFIEILFVIIIIGILTGISLPRFRNTFNSLQLNSASSELQSFMNYLSERAIVERKIIYFNIDTENKECWARIKDAREKLKTYSLPKEIGIKTNQKQILFYPDGRIDNIAIELTHRNNQSVILTSKGVYARIKLQAGH